MPPPREDWRPGAPYAPGLIAEYLWPGAAPDTAGVQELRDRITVLTAE